MEAPSFTLASEWHESDGNACCVDIVPGIVVVGTDTGMVHVYTYGSGSNNLLRPYITVPPPPSPGMSVATCKITIGPDKASIFVSYKRAANASSPRSNVGVCCYDIPLPGPNPANLSAPSARYDLDGRYVQSSALCDAVKTDKETFFTVVSRLSYRTFESLILSI